MNRQELITAMQATASAKPRKVTVAGWGDVYVRALTVAEVEAQNEDTEQPKLGLDGKPIIVDGKPLMEKVEDKNRLARAAARLLCDEEGIRTFDPENAEDVALLAKQPWKLLRQVLEEEKEEEKKAGN